MPKTHSVSIIIPCRDDYKYLSSILLDLSNLSPLPEIIVSDASKDHGAVKEICKHHQIKLLQVEPPSRGQQLDKGAEKLLRISCFFIILILILVRIIMIR